MKKTKGTHACDGDVSSGHVADVIFDPCPSAMKK